jgi:hypothetical protein
LFRNIKGRCATDVGNHHNKFVEVQCGMEHATSLSSEQREPRKLILLGLNMFIINRRKCDHLCWWWHRRNIITDDLFKLFQVFASPGATQSLLLVTPQETRGKTNFRSW